MNVRELSGVPLQRVEFCRRKVGIVPQSGGVYVISNYFESVLYIGLSKNLQSRILQHLNHEQKLELTPEGRAYWFHYKLCSEKELRPDERGWLLHYQLHEGRLPYFNKIG